jgi:RNA polymerase sigma-70 factor (ECF subfamily)
MQDEELMASVAAGDEESLATLYDRYAPRVLGLIQAIVHDISLAEDVLQEVFWQIWDRRANYRPQRGKPEAWILLLARSRAIDARRSRNARPERSLSDGTDRRGKFDESIQQVESSLDLAGPLATLPREEREVIHLAFFEGWTHREISERLGQPLGTVKSRIRNGIRRLSEKLVEPEGERRA